MKYIKAYCAAWPVCLGIRKATDDYAHIEANLTVSAGNLVIAAFFLAIFAVRVLVR